MGPREVLERLKWHPELDLQQALITITHRGAPSDMRIIQGNEIKKIGRGFMSVESAEGEVEIPYHRILRIEAGGERLWRKGEA